MWSVWGAVLYYCFRALERSGIGINALCPGPTDTNPFCELAGEGEYGNKARERLKPAITMCGVLQITGRPDNQLKLTNAG